MTDLTKGLPVPGYRPQATRAIEIVTGNKNIEEAVLRVLDKLALDHETDKRWLSIGRTQIEQGFMAINRAIFKPERLKLPEDSDVG
jgi:hypothetical protein